jgi:hypothetical protein
MRLQWLPAVAQEALEVMARFRFYRLTAVVWA